MSSSEKEMIGSSPTMERVNYLIQRVAHSDVDCLILGETGTGKELAAHKIHKLSWRNKGSFIPVNCSALSENLFENELFGHVKGAFTGATSDKKGRFEMAHNGTLFLDEIGELSPGMQVKLLRALQERQIEKVGDSKIVDVNVRVIAATNRNLKEMIQEGSFREDFYYRINVFCIRIPSLSQRKDDIATLARHFVDVYSADKKIVISKETMDILENYIWPGNIRQLENCIRHALVLATDTISPMHLPEDIIIDMKIDIPLLQDQKMPIDKTPVKQIKTNNVQQQSESPITGHSEKELLISALQKAKGNRSKAAEILGVSRVTIWHRMKKHSLLPKQNEVF